jgi:glucosamine--fructose-6-phosphate aminotransferase (isomerizing)
MCGIVGVFSAQQDVVPIILNGLSKLEYRGYDSSGLVVSKDDVLHTLKVVGRISRLQALTIEDNLSGMVGMGHTRWATHGAVNITNAHPHLSHQMIAVVHNGIIDNYLELKTYLQQAGYKFVSDTDTEVIAHLIHLNYVQCGDLHAATFATCKKLIGNYTIGVMCAASGQLICVKHGAPLLLATSGDVTIFASDIAAILPITRSVTNLHDGDIAVLSRTGYMVFDEHNNQVSRDVYTSNISNVNTELGVYAHYMQKEIFEQPAALENTLKYLQNIDSNLMMRDVSKIRIVACGTSYHAGIVAKYWFETIFGVSCECDIASEFRYRNIRDLRDTLLIVISQSGETADTIASVKYSRSLGVKCILAICNTAESTIMTLADIQVLTTAGIEIGVASTKAFTTQLLTLLFLSTASSDQQHHLQHISGLARIVIDSVEKSICEVAAAIYDSSSVLFVGRNVFYPIAQEGALKLKELSYIHAEGCALGELKHGSLALIDDKLPVIALLSKQILCDKTLSNIEEILTRNGRIFLITDSISGLEDLCKRCAKVIVMPQLSDVQSFLLPILYAIPLQLLAYHTAVLRGTDVDKPRNLAKSVTVE